MGKEQNDANGLVLYNFKRRLEGGYSAQQGTDWWEGAQPHNVPGISIEFLIQ